jgi:hypothetical protein
MGVEGLALVEPWHTVSPERRAQLEAEVVRELPPGHVLAGRPLAAAAARSDRDDVLFEVPGLGYAVVHLTWSSRRETSPEWPRAEVFTSIEEWRERVMQREHEEFGDAPKLMAGTFVREPRAEIYRGLIGVLATMAQRALLVERIMHTQDGVIFGGFSPEGERLRLRLDPWCVVEEERSEWPGTRLLSSTVLVREYTLSTEVISALQTTVEGLYEWQGGLPEDLALLREGGADLMFATSHESDGAVTLHPEERDQLLRECPGIADCIEWRPSGLR